MDRFGFIGFFASKFLLLFGLIGVFVLSAACGDEDDTDPYCGDGIVQFDEGEWCDDGSDNGPNGRCSDECRFNVGACNLDDALVCRGKCGTFVTADSCGQLALADCGDCTASDEVCGEDNTCGISVEIDGGSDGESGVGEDGTEVADASVDTSFEGDENVSVDGGSSFSDGGGI